MRLLRSAVAAARAGADAAGVRDAAFLAVAFFGMLRGSEALALRWEQRRFSQRGAKLLIRDSKTDQSAAGQWVFLGRLGEAALCPAAALESLHAAHAFPAQGAVFCARVGGQAAPRKSTMRRRLRRCLAACGVPAAALLSYALQSLRRGGATAAFKAEVPERLIMEHGRWRSDTVRIYMYADSEMKGP